jgi:hypothetical protein
MILVPAAAERSIRNAAVQVSRTALTATTIKRYNDKIKMRDRNCHG